MNKDFFIENEYVKKQYLNIPGEKWVDKLKYAFNEVDSTNSGKISKEQFLKSRLQYVISNEPMSLSQVSSFFDQINASNDSTITWDQLSDFLMAQQQAEMILATEQNLTIEYVGPEPSVWKQYKRGGRIIKVFYIVAIDNYAVLSDKALNFWDPKTCTISRTFSENEEFIDMALIPSFSRIAIAKANRTVIFYDIRSFVKAKEFISASEVPGDLRTSSKDTAIDIERKLSALDLPLFNKTTALGSWNAKPFLFVGDQDGYIEVFLIETNIALKSKLQITKLSLTRIHSSDITRIMYVDALESFASCSHDGSIKLWKFDEATSSITVINSFKFPDLRLSWIEFVAQTKEFVAITTSHCIAAWRSFTRIWKICETPGYPVTTLIPISISREESWVLTINSNNLVSTYLMPGLNKVDNWYLPTNCHSVCAPSASFIYEGKLFFVGIYMSCWKILCGNSDVAKPHKNAIVGLAISSDSKVASIDRSGTIFLWELSTGKKVRQLNVPDSECVSLAAFDSDCKKLAVAVDDGSIMMLSANSGSILGKIESKNLFGKITAVAFGDLGKNQSLFVSCVSKVIYKFDIITGNRFRYQSSYAGHTEQISFMCVLKKFYLLSIGEGRELFVWKSKSNPIKYAFDDEPTVACDIPNNQIQFIVGDVAGRIHIMSVNSTDHFSVIDAFCMTKEIPISSLCISKRILAVGNNLGFVRVIAINETLELKEIIRTNTDVVKYMATSDEFDILVTAGFDAEMAAYSFVDSLFVGRFGKNKLWNFSKRDTWIKEQPTPSIPYLFRSEEYDSDDDIEKEYSFNEREVSPADIHSINANKAKNSPILPQQQEEFSVSSCRRVIDEVEEMYNTKYGTRKKCSSDNIIKKIEEESRPKREPKFEVKDISLNLFNEDGVFKTIYKQKKPSNK